MDVRNALKVPAFTTERPMVLHQRGMNAGPNTDARKNPVNRTDRNKSKHVEKAATSLSFDAVLS